MTREFWRSRRTCFTEQFTNADVDIPVFFFCRHQFEENGLEAEDEDNYNNNNNCWSEYITMTSEDLLQPGHVVKERWKVVRNYWVECFNLWQYCFQYLKVCYYGAQTQVAEKHRAAKSVLHLELIVLLNAYDTAPTPKPRKLRRYM